MTAMTSVYKNGRKPMVPVINLFTDHDDGWPRTKDGWLVKPGSVVHFMNTWAKVTNIYDGVGDMGYCVEVEDGDGPQGWVRLSDCVMVPPRDTE